MPHILAPRKTTKGARRLTPESSHDSGKPLAAPREPAQADVMRQVLRLENSGKGTTRKTFAERFPNFLE